MHRKTLLQRLLPENQEKLNNCREKYPNTVKAIETELQNNYYIPDLTFSAVGYLYSLLDMRLDESTNDPFLKIYRAFGADDAENFENKFEETVAITE